MTTKKQLDPASNGRKGLLWLLGSTLALLAFQISLGGIVRVTGSGDACPDWPTCFGSWIPDLSNWMVLLEWGHRFTGAMSGVLIIITLIYALVKFRGRRSTIYFMITSLITVSIAGIVGGTVVLSELNPALRSLHLVIAESVVLTVAIAFALEFRSRHTRVDDLRVWKKGDIWSIVAIVAILLIIISGSYAVWRGAGLVCTSWPLCTNGDFLPQTELHWIGTAHRIVVLVGFLVAFLGVHYVMRRVSSRLAKWSAILVLTLIVIEILIGAATATTVNVAATSGLSWLLNLWRAAHLAVSNLVWLFVSLMGSLWLVASYRGRRDPQNNNG